MGGHGREQEGHLLLGRVADVATEEVEQGETHLDLRLHHEDHLYGDGANGPSHGAHPRNDGRRRRERSAAAGEVA